MILLLIEHHNNYILMQRTFVRKLDSLVTIMSLQNKFLLHVLFIERLFFQNIFKLNVLIYQKID
jgi:hypothetical protein